MIFAQLGANDPNFNLREQHALIHRVNSAQGHVFASVLETHGEYNGRLEFTVGAKSSVTSLLIHEVESYTVFEVDLTHGRQLTVIFTELGDQQTQHELDHAGRSLQWQGYYTVLQSQLNQSEE